VKGVPLPALEGTNPLGFLAALGVLDSMTRAGRDVTLGWTDELVPYAVLGGADDLDDLVEVLDRDRSRWAESLVLGFPHDSPLPDAKPSDSLLRGWYESVFEAADRNADADLLCAIVAEGAFDRNGNAKPTHFHFTAGQQQFLEMVRILAARVNRELLLEAICGPWAYDSSLPSLSWDARGERLYAVRATNPSKEKRLGVPGADWLAFSGLVFYPVSAVNGSLHTTACNTEWKRSAFRWPLWSAPATRNVVWSLVADETLVAHGATLRSRDLAARGVLRVLESPIRRSDQGGYGSFGGPETLAVGWQTPGNGC
jgi:hypothetical protein